MASAEDTLLSTRKYWSIPRIDRNAFLKKMVESRRVERQG